MKYKIFNFRIEPFSLEEEIAVFTFDIEFTEPTNLLSKDNFLMFNRRTVSKIKAINPEFYQFYLSTRNSLDKWGPSEISTIEAMGPEAMPIWFQIIEQLVSEDDEYLQGIYNLKLQQNSLSNEQKLQINQNAQIAFNELTESGNMAFLSQKKRNEFCEKAEKQIRALATELYPEILDLEADQLKKFKHLFAYEIDNMHKNLSRFLREGDGN
jgi:hypothetical protein